MRPDPEAEGVVVFDLDGTLTRYDTSLPFLEAVAGPGATRRGTRWAWLTALPDVVGAALAEWGGAKERRIGGVRGRWEGRAHERVASRTVRHRTRGELKTVGADFAATVVAEGLRPDALARIGGHRREGHRLILASASLDVYVEPLAELLGFDDAVSTRLAFRGDVATGGFDGLPCWGVEKLRRVRSLMEPGEEILHAYGDSPGDAYLLGAARNATWVV